jgi:hypothetical protein
MSAFMVGREHIWAIVDAWRKSQEHGWNSAPKFETLAEKGQMLWDENRSSVQYRYPDCEGNNLPGPVGCDFDYGTHEIDMGKPNYSPVEILKACHCLEYQSCEHPHWEESEARFFLVNIREAQERLMPGYEEAPWGIEDVEKPAGPCQHAVRMIREGMPCAECGATA